MKPFRYFAIYKPFGYISQFTKEHEQDRVLGELFEFPKEVYPIGRLDKESEGLLLLTNDHELNGLLLNPIHKTAKTYWVQLEGTIHDQAIKQLSEGVDIKINKTIYHTQKAICHPLKAHLDIPERIPGVRYRANIPTSWIEITIYEGKNRQVRKMCANVGFPVLRLIRISIGKYQLPQLKIGEIIELVRNQVI